MVHRIGGNGPIFNFNRTAKTNNAGKTNEVKTSQPIDIINNFSQIDRKDLDKINTFATMGLNLSPKAPTGSAEYYMAAAPEFNSWTGYLGISNEFKDEAVSLLKGYSQASLDFAEVSNNLTSSDSSFAQLFA